MKVKNLIDALLKQDPEADVVLHEFTGEPVMFVCTSKQFPNIVMLQIESDVNMKEELLERFKLIEEGSHENIEILKNATDKEAIALSVYKANIFQSITPDIIEKYLDKEHADMMRDFCKKHNLEY